MEYGIRLVVLKNQETPSLKSAMDSFEINQGVESSFIYEITIFFFFPFFGVSQLILCPIFTEKFKGRNPKGKNSSGWIA